MTVTLNPFADNSLIVVIAMAQYTTTLRADPFLGKVINQEVHNLAAGRTCAAGSDPADKNLRIKDECNHSVKGHVETGENRVNLLRLGLGPRVTIEQNAGTLGFQIPEFFFTISPTCTSGTRSPWRI